ncbi:MAG: hypothetical protein ACJ74O_04795, partial [Frankiaceae bacterium]
MTVAIAAAIAGLVTGLAGTPAGATGNPAVPRVVVVGVPGLRWGDVSATGTPALWALAGRGSVGNLSIRSAAALTCPADGWVMLGAGNRAEGPPHGALCPDAGSLPPLGFAGLRERNARLDLGAEVGALATALGARGDCVAAVGPGAPLGAARGDGDPAATEAGRPTPA